MKTYSSKEANLSFVYPDNWTVEQERNLISVFDNEHGVGALQFSFYPVRTTENIGLEYELEEYIIKRHGSAEVIRNNDFVFSNSIKDARNKYWRYWLFLRVNFLILVSYNCQKDDAGKEDEVVNQIITSIVRGI